MNAENRSARVQPGADTEKHYTAKHTAPSNYKQSTKGLIVGLACWGVLPILLAGFLIRHFHLEAE